MKKLAIAVGFLAVLAACGPEYVNNDKAKEQVYECIAQGGHPEYTVDRDGGIQQFLVCYP